MTTNEQPMKWFRVIDGSSLKKEPVNVMAKDEADACLIVARQWFGALPGCCMDTVLQHVKAVAYTDDGRITKIEGMTGLPGRQCLPPSISECQQMNSAKKSEQGA